MAAWTTYAAVSAGLLFLLVLGVALAIPAGNDGALWLAAGVAFVVQLVAFAALVVGKRRGSSFVVSWASGMLLRFAAIAAVAFWVTRATDLDPAVSLLSLVGFVFVLVLLEPLFLRLADETDA